MSYKDLIIQEGEYTYSANIQFDITSDSKLLKYIPNETTIELFKEIFSDMLRLNANNHSRIIYGSYGTGKSHFLTVLGQILGKTFTEGVAYSTFLTRVKEFDLGLSNDIENYISDANRKPFLIVPIVFDFDDFDRCIYFSLKKKVESLGIKIKYKTFFVQASALLSQWKDNEESSIRLYEIAKSKRINIQKLENQLELFDPKSEKIFNKLFEAMTFGVKYVYEASNMSEILNQTNEVISDRYSGIVFIFDEFGRYIEDNLRSIKVKAVQNFAEYCDHCTGNNHIILVSHKEISQYTEHYGKKISDEWKKVEGRYKALSINSKQDQCLSIIRSVLIKSEPAWSNFALAYKKQLNEIYNSVVNFKGFAINYKDNNPVEAAFPLHPITLFALDRLSKRVAQNDRTFFTYLAGNESNSLYKFLLKHELNEFHYVGIDEIFDYFEDNIKSLQSDASYEWYKKYDASISKGQYDEYTDVIKIKILKVLTVIGIINDSSLLSSNKYTLLNSIDEDNDKIILALEELCDKKIIKYSVIYNRYDFFDSSIFDVEEMILEGSLHITSDAVENVLNENFIKFVLYPHRYNHSYKITRIFIPVFKMEDSISKNILTSKIGHFYDGLLIMVLGNADTSIESMSIYSEQHERCILWVNRDSLLLVNNVKKYIAAKYLEAHKSNYVSKDPVFETELTYHIQELSQAIENNINEWIGFTSSNYFLVSEGVHHLEIEKFAQVSELASKMMFDAFPNALIVNNELINKNTVSGSMVAAKKNAIRAMLSEHFLDDYFGLQYLSPDYIAVRSVLCKNGFVKFNEKISQNTVNGNLKPQNEISKVIKRFISKSKKNVVCFNDLYVTLKKPPYGLRDGYLSLMFAFVLLKYKKSLVISSHGKEQEITAELFEEIVKKPADYSFSVATWSKEELKFIGSLEDVFKDKIDENAINKNRLKAIYDGMISHYKSVPKFARTTTKYIAEKTIQYRQLMEKSYSSYTNFFFVVLKELTGDLCSSLEIIKNSKNDLDNAVSVLCKDLKHVFCKEFAVSPACKLSNAFCELYKSDWINKRVKAFDYYTNAFLDYAGKAGKASDIEILYQLGKILTGIEIEYWNDNHRIEFEERLFEINGKLSSYTNLTKLKDSETKMTLTASTGEEKTIIFDNTGLSDLGITIKNKINSTFGNFGLSVTYEDKVQILLALLNDLMEGK